MPQTICSDPSPEHATAQNGKAGEKKTNKQREQKLLAFSYLFVPLLFLGMKGEKEREK